jgi:deazaflavin-dependent oxidoreductase (nitroreductase family)
MGTPIGGWLLVIRVRGRKTGLGHDVPLSYLIEDGCVWVMAGFGQGTQWYRNLLADPHVELVLPGRLPMHAIAEEVRNREIRARILPRLYPATGVPGYLAGANPFRASDERILEVTGWLPLIRLRPEGEPLIAGPDDPRGHGWVWRQVVMLTLTAWATRRMVGLGRGLVSRLPRPDR